MYCWVFAKYCWVFAKLCAESLVFIRGSVGPQEAVKATSRTVTLCTATLARQHTPAFAVLRCDNPVRWGAAALVSRRETE
jgi:hypothetical protein